MKLTIFSTLLFFLVLLAGCVTESDTLAGEIQTEAWCDQDSARPWIGCWGEVSQIDCKSGQEFEADEIIGELRLNADGGYSITRHPFEQWVDHAGTYTVTETSSTITFSPIDMPGFDGDGSFSIRENGDLILNDIWFGIYFDADEPNSDPDSNPEVVSCGYVFRNEDVVTYGLNEPISLTVGEMATLEDDAGKDVVDITFVGVGEDSRCPKSTESDVMCAWSGAVEVKMEATANGRSETFPLIGITDYDGVVTGSIISETPSMWWYFDGFDIEFRQVTPYPAAADRPSPDEYAATVIVYLAKTPLPTATVVAPSIVDLIDESGQPMLCVSEKALAEWAAGAAEGEPAQLTPPLAAQALPDVQAADEICTLAFGEGWEIVEVGELDGWWSEFLPAAGVKFWMGGETDDVVLRSDVAGE